MANYLGLSIESVSRLLTKYKNHGLLKVDKREIQILLPESLKLLAENEDDADKVWEFVGEKC